MRIGKASSAFGRLRKPLWSRRNISTCTKLRVFNAAVMSVLLYGAATWCPTQADLSKLEVFQMSCLRSICGVSLRDRLHNAEIRLRCQNQPTVETKLRHIRLRWLGHVARMDNSKICHKLWLAQKPAAWRCARNAPKKTWDKLVTADLSFLKQTYGAALWSRSCASIITDLAQDRTQWRRLITAGQSTAIT